MEEGDLSIDQLLRELKQAEARDEQASSQCLSYGYTDNCCLNSCP